MKIRAHLEDARYVDLSWQNRVQCTPDGLGVPALRNPHTGRLSKRMHSGVGSACAKDGDVGPAKALQRVFEHSLDRPFIRLPLPPCEVSSVVLNNELQRSHFHCQNYRRAALAANLSPLMALTLEKAKGKLGTALPTHQQKRS